MAKPKPRRVPSDACAVRVDGETCYPHDGEAVELISSETVGELRARVRFGRIGAEIDGVRGEPDEGRRANEILSRHQEELCEYLAARVFAWDWTDDRGRPLPPPADEEGRPLGLLRLRADELWWLMNAVAPPEADAERGNG